MGCGVIGQDRSCRVIWGYGVLWAYGVLWGDVG